MAGSGHFDAHAAAYDRGRPPYPPDLWTRLTDLGLLAPGTRVVELGAGTGQATGPMLQAGARVTAVEPGPALAERLRRHCPAADVRAETAETVALPPAAFDLAVAATAVHWLDLDVVLPKLHRALVPSGHLAVWRTVFGDPAAPVSTFRARVGEIAAARERRPRSGPGALDTAAWVGRLTAGGHFAAVTVEELRWSVELGTEPVRDLFTTFSDWQPHEVEQAATAVDALGGRVLEHYVTPLIVLVRVDASQRQPSTGSRAAS